MKRDRCHHIRSAEPLPIFRGSNKRPCLLLSQSSEATALPFVIVYVRPQRQLRSDLLEELVGSSRSFARSAAFQVCFRFNIVVSAYSALPLTVLPASALSASVLPAPALPASAMFTSALSASNFLTSAISTFVFLRRFHH